MKLRNLFNISNITPNFKNKIVKEWGKNFAAPSDGWIYVYAQINNTTVSVKIENQYVYRLYNNSYVDGSGILLPIGKGENVSFEGNPYTNAGNASIIIFFPCKGAL